MTEQNKLRLPAYNAVIKCLGVKEYEKVLIVTNPSLMNISEALYIEAKKVFSEPEIVVYSDGKMNGEEPPEHIAAKMMKADVVFAPTVMSISHTEARRNACKNGARIATMPGITIDTFIRGMSADYEEIEKITDRVAKYMNKAKTAHVTSPYGMDLHLDISNPADICNGMIFNPGDFTNLPDGECALAPVTANGTLVANVCDEFITEPTKIEIKNGYIVGFDSNESGQRFKKLIEDAKKLDGNNNAEFIAEFAIGTNPTAQVVGNVLEDEKVLGTCHIAFGDSTSFEGGTNKSVLHMDVIILDPTITLDSTMIMEKGKLLI